MRPLLVFLPLLVSIILPKLAFAQGLTIKPLTKDYYVFTTYQTYNNAPMPANGVYVVTPKGAFLIDAPWDTLQTLPLIDSIQRRHGVAVVGALATHFHADRTGSFGVLNRMGISTYSSKQTKELCIKYDEKTAAHTFLKDTVFSVGSHALQVRYFGPGHAPDNLVVYDAANAVLVGGCLIKSTEATDLGNLSDADPTKWPSTIRAVNNAYPKARFVVPGHGGWGKGSALRHTLFLLEKNGK
jgi:metallo-beta-lactamase class B